MITIKIGDSSAIPLRALEVGRNSAFVARIIGVPAEYGNVQLHFGVPNSEGANAVVCKPIPGGDWKAYATGAYFPTVGKSHYHVTAKTAEGDGVYLGAGTLRVAASVVNVDDPANLIVPPNMYAFSPDNGLYYKVTAKLDADGVPFLVVDKNGVER